MVPIHTHIGIEIDSKEDIVGVSGPMASYNFVNVKLLLLPVNVLAVDLALSSGPGNKLSTTRTRERERERERELLKCSESV